ncbi:MAG: type II toxin-antitoxin system VapC family toxin [Clostridia bacterium]|nr:type II toxin-antitoxin system VapC family toxin [Clostridia bacterium]
MSERARFESCVCVDASLVVKWLVSEPDSLQALDVLEEWMRQGVRMIAPSLIDYEVASVLRKLAARGSVSVDEARQRLHLFESLAIQHVSPPFLLRRAWEMANRHGLYTVYDASYAALSELTGTRLYTCDEALISALGWSPDMIVNPLAKA